ncbi:flavodoxin family protein [Lactobacillus kunkeei]|uniref:flavodoxin family protein n=1 Tax=Apilactobacillus kunkeei TaxID=148814 RepID=UPI001363E8E2|nr:flavodoxin family protein [Apilactobacillus kunkeei]NBI00801.1 flavodoxin family protein [Apilactobacillus kunkeei]CAI2549922.1 hypothetical protein AKUA2101_00470 [Apilactobacillus kunkeei]CAI2550464.1 hypothetical protein AKUA1805_00470 [Apilactobacillus kunkeei]CAI2606238.1 hypothetical protein AKUH4B504J_00450 [Apilactobacillus kunkeei]
MTTLFINCSKDKHGLTESLVSDITTEYETVNLVDYRIYPLGQENRSDDEFHEVISKIDNADDLIIGTPVYWSSMSAYMKILIDRMTTFLHDGNPFVGKPLSIIIDGSMPDDAIEHITHVWNHIAKRYGMTYEKTITN